MILDDDVGNVLVQRNCYMVSHVTYAHRRETAILGNSFVWLQSVDLTLQAHSEPANSLLRVSQYR